MFAPSRVLALPFAAAALLAWSACSSPPATTGTAEASAATGDAVATAGAPPAPPAYGTEGTAQLFAGLGTWSRPVTTSSATAQSFFDQGLAWLHGFNFDEAVRSFTRATELDPGCAMAWWGIAVAQGPNYNNPAPSPAREAAAWAALQQAREALDDETPLERALIEALGSRYTDPAPEDRKELDAAYAEAMADVWRRFPESPDVGALYAEAMMVKHPWKLYDDDEQPAREETNTIVATLEHVLARAPQHPGANHLYIHAIEPSADKERAIPAADRLSDLVPASGHLRHMPSHIYVQTAMWGRSIEQNEKAMAADRAYRALSPEQGEHNGYMTHNTHMLAFSAMMVGREAEARAAANAQWEDLPMGTLEKYGAFFDVMMCSKYDVLKRFGRWQELVDEPAPPAFLPITRMVWRAHRAIAHAALHDFDSARRDHENFRAAMHTFAEKMKDGGEEAERMVDFLKVSDLFIAGEVALQKEEWGEAIRFLEEAAEVEDSLGYGEPPLWLQPVRHTLGAVHLKAGRPADAERVYREDLEKWPGNGWSLYGLTRALEEQGKADEATAARARFEAAWANADAPIATSCKCIERT